MQKKTHVLSIDSKYSLIGIRTNTAMHKLAYYLKRDKNNVSFSYTEQFVDSYKYNPGIIAIRWYTNKKIYSKT